MEELHTAHIPDTRGAQKSVYTILVLTISLGLVVFKNSKGLLVALLSGKKVWLGLSHVYYRISVTSKEAKREYMPKPVNTSSSDINGVSSSTTSKMSGKLAVWVCPVGSPVRCFHPCMLVRLLVGMHWETGGLSSVDWWVPLFPVPLWGIEILKASTGKKSLVY